MSKTSQQLDWWKPNAQQQVSRRSIYRVQSISDHLLERFNAILGDDKIKEILFAARDYDVSYTEENDKRYYNFRLCASYGFTKISWEKFLKFANDESIREIFEIAKKSAPKGSTKHLRWSTFKSEIAAAEAADEKKDRDRLQRKCLSDFLVALAEAPYSGVVPSWLDKEDKNPTINLKYPILFTDKDVGKANPFQWCVLDKVPDPLEDLNTNRLEELNKFILEFTRGDSKVHNYMVEVKSSNLNGFAFPCYDLWVKEEKNQNSFKPSGGMLGWIVFIANKKAASVFTEKSTQPPIFETCTYQFLEAFASRVREATMQDLLEDYLEDAGTLPGEFFEANLHKVTGFRGDTKGSYNLKLPLEKKELDIKVRPLPDTEDPNKLQNSPGTLKMCRNFWDRLEQIHETRIIGKRLGQLVSAHDYSKELNGIEIAYSQFDELIDTVINKIETVDFASSDNKKDVLAQLDRLVIPNNHAFLRRRFLFGHQFIESAGYIHGFPAQCLEWLRDGRKKSIYCLLRALIWVPIPPINKNSEPKFSDLWCRAYDFQTPNFEKSALYIKCNALFEELMNKSSNDTAQSFKILNDWVTIPKLNPDASSEQQILWPNPPPNAPCLLPMKGLLPILVFALRCAFQAAWLWSLSLATKHKKKSPLPKIDLASSLDRSRGGSLTLSFPSLTEDKSLHQQLVEEFSAHTERYAGLSRWNPEFKLDSDKSIISITF